MRPVVYTAITGDYERIKPHAEQDIDCDWVAFTPSSMRPEAKNAGWTPHAVSYSWGSDALDAKFYKMFPDLVVPAYEQSLWLDGSVEVRSSSFVREALRVLEWDSMGAFVHPYRDCIYEEAHATLTFPKWAWAESAFRAQCDHYASLGYPRHAGLWCGGILARDHTPAVRRLMQAWWRECRRWTLQDQLSLPVVARNTHGVRILPLSPHLDSTDHIVIHYDRSSA